MMFFRISVPIYKSELVWNLHRRESGLSHVSGRRSVYFAGWLLRLHVTWQSAGVHTPLSLCNCLHVFVLLFFFLLEISSWCKIVFSFSFTFNEWGSSITFFLIKSERLTLRKENLWDAAAEGRDLRTTRVSSLRSRGGRCGWMRWWDLLAVGRAVRCLPAGGWVSVIYAHEFSQITTISIMLIGKANARSDDGLLSMHLIFKVMFIVKNIYAKASIKYIYTV